MSKNIKKNIHKEPSKIASTSKPKSNDKLVVQRSKGAANASNIATGSKLEKTEEKLKVPKPIQSRTSVYSKSVSQSQSVLKKTILNSSVIKPSPKNVSNGRSKPVPLKATASISHKTMMTKIHNVTVSTPPAQRKHEPLEPITRERTQTRTLEPHEIIILRQQQDSKKNNRNENDDEMSEDSIVDIKKKAQIREPIKFEIQFEKASTSKEHHVPEIKQKDSEDDNYEDDFESYESDFESEIESSTEEKPSDLDNQMIMGGSESESPMSLAQSPHESLTIVTNIQIFQDDKKLDSGNYEISGSKDRTVVLGVRHDEVISYNSDGQIDSGLGYLPDDVSAVKCIQPDLLKQSKSVKKSLSPLQIRGRDLMKKIHLDTMTFAIFETRSMSYEYFMKIYGSVDATQNSSQTNEDVLNEETQTDEQIFKSIWTQHPPHLSESGLTNPFTKSYFDEKRGTGDDNVLFNQNHDNLLPTVPILDDSYRLNVMLQKASITILNVLGRQSKNTNRQNSYLKIAHDYTKLNTKSAELLFHDLRVLKIYTDIMVANTILTVHKGNVTSHNHQNLICVWNLFDLRMPFKVLSIWSTICCLHMSVNCSYIVFAGLVDGALAVWDLREYTYWHQKVENYVVNVPSQVVLPENMVLRNENQINDYGRLIAIKSMGTNYTFGFNQMQICTLHEIGFFTVWTIIESKLNEFDTTIYGHNDEQHFLNVSPWSRVRLIQSAHLDLRLLCGKSSQDIINSKIHTRFEKTRSYFENDIFSDEILRELNGNDERDLEKNLFRKNVKFIDVEVIGQSGFFIGLNKNYIYFCPKSLKVENCRRITVDDRYLTVTRLRKFNDRRHLAVGLSDGTIKIFSCAIDDQLKSDEFSRYKNAADDVGNDVADKKSGQHLTNNMSFTSKSCTIQNMIKGERKIYENQQALNNLDYREVKPSTSSSSSTPSTTSTINDVVILKRKYHFKTQSDQILLNNFLLKDFNFKSIHVSDDDKLMFCQIGDHLKCYDLEYNSEIEQMIQLDGGAVNNVVVTDLSLVRNDNGKLYLIVLRGNEIEIHELME